MAEVYWMDGLQMPFTQGQSIMELIGNWLEEKFIRASWVEQINVLYDGVLPEGFPQGEQSDLIQPGFRFTQATMDEHLFLQQIIRRIRSDETEGQIFVNLQGGILNAALFMSHRQVGRSNLPPRYIVGEQMVVLGFRMLQTRLEALPDEFEHGVYIFGPQPALFQNIFVEEHALINHAPTQSNSIIGCILEISMQEQYHSQLGFMVSRQAGQPTLVTSIKGC